MYAYLHVGVWGCICVCPAFLETSYSAYLVLVVQVAPVLVTPSLLERMRNNYMVIEVWDKKTSAENDKVHCQIFVTLSALCYALRSLLHCQYVMLSDLCYTVSTLLHCQHFVTLSALCWTLSTLLHCQLFATWSCSVSSLLHCQHLVMPSALGVWMCLKCVDVCLEMGVCEGGVSVCVCVCSLVFMCVPRLC